MTDSSGASYERRERTPAAGSRRFFSPRLWPSLALLVLLPAFVGLGFWQWHKAEAKEAAQALLEARRLEPPLRLPAQILDGEALRYRRVVARGSFEPQRQILLDNRVHRGQAGYHVLTPLRLEGGGLRVLVDRGWIAALPDRRQLPPTPAPAGTLDIAGYVALPPAGYFSLGAESPGWRPVWQHLDLARYQALAGVPLQPFVIELDAASPGAYAGDRPRPDAGSERHRAYALQWWAFAATAAALWLCHGIRRT